MNGGSTETWSDINPDEKRVLEDIYEWTGRAFRRVQGIRTEDPLIAEKVLPILIQWYPRMPHSGYRAAIADRFKYPTALPYINVVLNWWLNEQDELCRGWITQVVAELTESSNCARVWDAYRRAPQDLFSVFVLRKLAGCKLTRQAALDEVVRMLKDGPPGYGPLEIISKINDPRIRLWFRERLADPDPEIRRLASRLVKRGKPLPAQVRRSADGPDRLEEYFSAEGNLRDIGEYFQVAERRVGVKIPAWLKKAQFLDQVERDEWVWTEVRAKAGGMIRVWLRLEDLDVVEMVFGPGGDEGEEAPEADC